MQGTRVRALVREDPTCCGATKPMHPNYWACALEPASHNYWSPHASSPGSTREATAMRSPRTATKSSPCSPQLEKAHAQQRRPNTAKKKKNFKVKVQRPLCSSSILDLINNGSSRIGVKYHLLHTLVQLSLQFVIYNFIPVIFPIILHCFSKEWSPDFTWIPEGARVF